MAHITEEHLHHMARRHHATMKKLDGMRERFSGMAGRFVGTIESAAGAWLGGTIEGRTGGAAIGPLPVNLGVGVLLIAGSHLEMARKWSDDLNHLGNGFIGSWLAATGYAWGKRWKDTGKMLGGGGHPWTHPYEVPAPPAP